ncbi:MAG: hypothetical protein HKP06_09105 [Flavobacteriaceae bacterium]|nr:hypothetical protein [Flavobacteriaceae bacterium]
MNIYHGGPPVLHTRRQRGSGFFSSLKRIALPIAKRLFKTAAPHIVGGIADVASGADVKETLKRRAANVGSDVLQDVAEQVHPSKRRRQSKTYINKSRTKKWK